MSGFAHVLNLGDEQATFSGEDLLPLLYQELRSLARSKLAFESPGYTLQATGLVHEAFLRMNAMDTECRWDSKAHFFASAAESMRRILVDRARRKACVKHGGDRLKVDLPESQLRAKSCDEQHVLVLSDAIDCLEQHDPDAAAIAKLRLFAGLSIEDAALASGQSRATGYRNWTYARAYLQSQCEDANHETPSRPKPK